jgi:pyridoxal biosynthesis lyase PdxS
VRWVAENGQLPVVTFTAGGIATPADAALCMQLGADGVFVGSGIFKSGDPEKRAKAIVEATTHFEDAKVLADVSAGLGEPMVGISTHGGGRMPSAGMAAPGSVADPLSVLFVKLYAPISFLLALLMLALARSLTF